MALQDLRGYLNSLAAGPISEKDFQVLLLANCWYEFSGSSVKNMEPEKLHGRMEEITWSPPKLSFVIERHGGTVNGSSRAELHRWELDIDARTASCSSSGSRQLKPNQPKLDLDPIAKEVVNLILNHRHDERLKWKSDGSVLVQIGKILPARSAAKQTVESRRKRFRQEVEQLLTQHDWTIGEKNLYVPPPSD